MTTETLERVEAMLLSLRDQLDRLTEQVDQRFTDQHRLMSRLHAEWVEASLERRALDLEDDPLPPVPPLPPAVAAVLRLASARAP